VRSSTHRSSASYRAMRGIANELKKRKVQPPRGGSWHPQLVKRIMQRWQAARCDLGNSRSTTPL
jgi:hypothetical protein